MLLKEWNRLEFQRQLEQLDRVAPPHSLLVVGRQINVPPPRLRIFDRVVRVIYTRQCQTSVAQQPTKTKSGLKGGTEGNAPIENKTRSTPISLMENLRARVEKKPEVVTWMLWRK